MSNHKNQEISQKSRPLPDGSKLFISLALYKAAKGNDIFYFRVIKKLLTNTDEETKERIKGYFGDLMDEDKKEAK